MKLSDAVAKLQDGLARLPDFESKAKQLTALGVQTMEEGWQIEDEMNPEPLHRLLAKGETLPAKPMKLAPITAVDDPQFKVAMQASVNMPEYAKRAFDD